MFLPTTREEMDILGWDALDIIIVSGDSYIDSPFMGTAVIGKVLADAGYRVGIIAQPETSHTRDVGRLGAPQLFWGVTAGSIDSMVSNYTALKKKRRNDDYTPGGENNKRPDRATIVYTGLIRRYMKTVQKFATESAKNREKSIKEEKTAPPIVLGGIEASLRRVPHYDYWTNKIRRSLLFDAKADYLLYGMAEKSTLEFAAALRDGKDPHNIRGLSYIAKEKREDYIEMASYENVAKDKIAFMDFFDIFYKNNDPLSSKGLTQKHGDRWLVQNPPALYQTQEELDKIYALDFERAQHPYYRKHGKVRALDTVGFSIPTHRGCYGECNFCAIAVHEGRTIRSRSQNSIVLEAKEITKHPKFKGYISDLGGPTANMYGYEC
ncbi:MAG: YgiQ family radical SAM protein, partial [Chloroflexi bacterium]|nr:YgiQ family radical SAM protein [Chloroflexota bacterium]